MAERLVVIGGDAGGMTAATSARRLRSRTSRSWPSRRAPRTSYSACGIPYLVSADWSMSLDDLVARTPARVRASNRIDVRIRHEVTGIDLDRRQVEVHDLDHGRTIRIGFDHLLIGTGAGPIAPEPAGHRRRLRSTACRPSTTRADLLAHAEKSRCTRVVVVGGGYIGLEMAEAFVHVGRRGHRGRARRPGHADARSRHGGAGRRRRMERHYVDVRLGVHGRPGFEPGRCSPTAAHRGRPGGARPRRHAQHRAGRADAGIELGVHAARSGSTAASAPTPRACGRPATAPSRSTWSAGDRSTSRWAPSPTGRAGWPASTSAGATPRSRAWSAPPSPRCASTEVARTGLTEAEAAARRASEPSAGHHREHHPGRLLPRGRADHGEAGGRGGHRPAARWPDRRAGTARPSASTWWPPPSPPG